MGACLKQLCTKQAHIPLPGFLPLSDKLLHLYPPLRDNPSYQLKRKNLDFKAPSFRSTSDDLDKTYKYFVDQKPKLPNFTKPSVFTYSTLPIFLSRGKVNKPFAL